ncbi:alpha,alpha-trehalase TreF [Emticicia sp. W12TSBA100-4]|uniref:alpha,alpha-trehalase TreF n=1 Tax=Emticicia sp. W12TSBA100-4 TaxID=3160965 RepID=UPI0033063296
MTTNFLKHAFLTIIISIIALGCGDTVSKKTYKSPDEEYGELFKEVQLKAVFADSKTFPDCLPKIKAEEVMKKYEEQKKSKNFDLRKFILENFTMPSSGNNNYVSNPNNTAEQHINELWSVLTRKPKDIGGTLVPLLKPHIVPDGRFSEVNYWDSYFTMLGLQVSGRDSLMSNTVLNFAQLIQDFGHIPSGNRSYYFSRSQPPFFTSMVKLLSEMKGHEDKLVQTLPQIQREYQYWMAVENGGEDAQKQNEARKKGDKAYRKTVFIGKDGMLNRYYDDKDTPRPEAYKEDILIANKSGRKVNQIYRDLRSGAESGWSFSSRWLRDGQNLATIHTTDILPVDLNAILYDMELTLAAIYKAKNEPEYAKSLEQLANKRKAIFDNYFWNEVAGFYFDYDFVAGKQTDVYSLAAVYPLFFKIATPVQAEKVAKVLETKFLQAGGLMTTLNQTNQQWDGANGFAPLQYLAIQGLRNYGFNDLANKIKQNWVYNNLKIYKATGKMVDKYNVSDLSGGEYPRQDGFGWTNGVLLKLLSEKP